MNQFVNFFGNLRRISPRVQLGEDRLTICVMEPHIGDWVLAASLCIVGLPLTYYTTTTPMYFGASFLFFIVMANSLIDDTYEVVLDKVKNEAAVTKMRFGRTEWIRISPLDELVNCEVVSTTHRHLTSFRLELEFMTEFGYHRLSASDSTVLGEYNKSKFQELAQTIIDFMKLKPIPEWLKEENLASSLPPRKADSKKAKKSQ